MLPVRKTGQDDALKVLDHGAESFGSGGGVVGSWARMAPGSRVRHHRPFVQPHAVFRDPIDQLMAIAAEVFGRHGSPYDVRGEIMRRSFCTRAGGMATSAP